jgi:hypothetical protein
MRLSIRFLTLVVIASVISLPMAHAQTQLVTSSPFPAEMEFQELKAVQKERALKDGAKFAALENGPILMEAGLKEYAQRIYTLADSGSLSIEVFTMADARGAYSLLSLQNQTGILAGPPGDFQAGGADALMFSAGHLFICIRTTHTGTLARRVAISTANRIGSGGSKKPSLIGHIPKDECNQVFGRYFMGPRAVRTWGATVAGAALGMPLEVEAVQTPCVQSGQTGTLTLMSFPTIQLAEEYFDAGAVFRRDPASDHNLYTRQTGTLVGILEGNFGATLADKILGSIKFTYAVQWIFDKNSGRSRIIWGVPAKILGTVVRSLLFTALLCLVSIAAGILIASGRMIVHKRWGRSHDSEFIRLKINEN